MDAFPMRINKYLAYRKLCTRKDADRFIENGLVSINGRTARLGDKVARDDHVELRAPARTFTYLAYYKPRGIVTHSAQRSKPGGEKEIRDVLPVTGVFPVGRLDKDSSGLIILTDDGRLTDALLNPEHVHDKEYEVTSRERLPSFLKQRFESGVQIEGYMTRPARVEIEGPKKFFITLTEGKKHQIRRMCDKVGVAIAELTRVRILNVKLGGLKPGQYRRLRTDELRTFLAAVGLA